MKPIARALATCLLFIGTACGAEWQDLFNGKDLAGWEPQSKVDWQVKDGAIIATKGDRGLLTTRDTFQDYEFEAEFRAPAGTNSGVFLATPKTVNDPAKDCYELNIAPPSNPFPTGSLVGRTRYEGGEVPEWRKFRVKVESGHVQVWLNDKQIVDYKDPNPLKANYIGLQFNVGQIEFRGVRIRKLGQP